MKQPQKLSDIMHDLAQQPIRDERSGEINILAMWFNRQKSKDDGKE